MKYNMNSCIQVRNCKDALKVNSPPIIKFNNNKKRKTSKIKQSEFETWTFDLRKPCMFWIAPEIWGDPKHPMTLRTSAEIPLNPAMPKRAALHTHTHHQSERAGMCAHTFV